MNKNGEDIDLGLALGSRNNSVETRLNSSSAAGAGANASSRAEMPFAASDPLSELVWSPRNGLSLKCANSSLAINRPLYTWNVGEIRDEKMLDEDGNSGEKATMFRHSGGSSSCGGLVKKDTGTGSIEEENRKGDNKEDLCSSQNFLLVGTAESSKINAELDRKSDTAINWNFSSDLLRGSGCMRLPVPIRSEPPDPNVQPHYEVDDEVSSASPDVNKTKSTGMKLESSSENNLGSNLVAKEASLPLDAAPTNSRICLYREKGKEIALSNDENDSHESVESCNSTGLFPIGLKRQRHDQGRQLVKLESKMVKKCLRGSPGSASVLKTDSSFMNWISNMVKGLADSKRKEPSLLALALPRATNICSYKESLVCNKTANFPKPRTGFQNVFQSLYCQNKTTPTPAVQKESIELMAADKKSASDEEFNPHMFLTGNTSEKSFAEDNTLDIPECSRDIIEGKPHTKEDTTEKPGPLSSLWITRLYTRTAEFDEALKCNSKHINDVFSIGEKASEASGDSEGVKPNLTQPFQELSSLEAMTSVFAKRLDALRHILHPSGTRDPPTFPQKCFFCGNNGHDLRKCPELTEVELENLLTNISSFRRVGESTCLCIRCFELDHWAISCPLGSLQEHRGSKQNVAGSFPNFRVWNMKESSSRRLSTSNELQNSTLSNPRSHIKEKQKLQHSMLFKTQIAIPQEEMFHAIRKLRLSRADILRWLDSDVSLSHLNGYFLRLRFGKLEGMVGGTGYYVACITGDSIENNDCKNEKSVLVDIGGMKSSVGSQYISNQDFIEEEIQGWWSRIVKNGGKVPTLDELNSRFESGKCLAL